MDPNKEQQAQYEAVQAAHAAAVAALVEDAPMSAAYQAVVQALKVGSGMRCWPGLPLPLLLTAHVVAW